MHPTYMPDINLLRPKPGPVSPVSLRALDSAYGTAGLIKAWHFPMCNSVVHFMVSLTGQGELRYLVKHYSGCSCDSVFG